MSNSTLAGTSSAIRISGASARTGCVISSGSDREPQTERPCPLRSIDVISRARRPLDEEVDLRSSARKWRARPQREGRLVHLLTVREERKGSPPCTGANRHVLTEDLRPNRIDAKPEIPGILRVHPL